MYQVKPKSKPSSEPRTLDDNAPAKGAAKEKRQKGCIAFRPSLLLCVVTAVAPPS